MEHASSVNAHVRWMGLPHALQVARLLNLVEEELTKPAQPMSPFLLLYYRVTSCVTVGLYNGYYSRLAKYRHSVLFVVHFVVGKIHSVCTLPRVVLRIFFVWRMARR